MSTIRWLPAWSSVSRRIFVDPSRVATTIRPLTERQLDVLQRTCRGETTQQIADALGVSLGGIRAKRRVAYQKLRVTNHTDACAELARLESLPLDDPIREPPTRGRARP